MGSFSLPSRTELREVFERGGVEMWNLLCKVFGDKTRGREIEFASRKEGENFAFEGRGEIKEVV